MRTQEEENEHLKQSIAKQTLELEVKSKLFKKRPRGRYQNLEKITTMNQYQQQVPPSELCEWLQCVLLPA